jgi:hypothetical protein
VKYHGKTQFINQSTYKKNEGQESKIGPFRRWILVGGERVNEESEGEQI